MAEPLTNPFAFERAGLSLCASGRDDPAYRQRFDKIVIDLREDLGEEFANGMDRWTGVAKTYEFDHWTVYTAQDGNNDVMAVAGIYQVPSDSSDTFWLGWFGVHHAYRHQGIGRSLLDIVVSAASNLGGRTLRLYTSDHNIEAHKLYESMCFVKDGILADYPPPQGDADPTSSVYSRVVR